MARQITTILVACVILVFEISAFAQPVSFEVADLNGDQSLDCGDIDLLSAAIRSGTYDATFDLNSNGSLGLDDIETFRVVVSHDRGFGGEILHDAGDVNFDGIINHVDANVQGLNWLQPTTSWCQTDFNLDGIVSNFADDNYLRIPWQTGIRPYTPQGAEVLPVELPNVLDAWRFDQPIPFARVGPFEIVVTPVRAPDGVIGSNVAVRTVDPDHRIATFHRIAITGDIHQTWLSDPFSEPTAKGPPRVWGAYHSAWVPYDSHLLLTNDQVGLDYGGGYGGISETNDGSNPVSADEQLPDVSGFAAKTGLGDLESSSETDTFTLQREAQSSLVDFAYLVTPAVLPESENQGEIFLTFGVLGGDADSQPLPDVGVIGLNERLRVPFFAEPCDFNADGYCNAVDIDRLLSDLGTENDRLNLDPTTADISLEDLIAWLVDAGLEKTNAPYAVGDIDLDGNVDATDLNVLALNWQRQGNVGWADGDLNGDSKVDVADLNELALNWQLSIPMASSTSAPVPEPSAWLLSIIGLALGLATIRLQLATSAASRCTKVSLRNCCSCCRWHRPTLQNCRTRVFF